MSEAVERARQRREEEELKIHASKSKAREKLKLLEERLAERRKADSTSSGKDKTDDDDAGGPEAERTRTVSSGSDVDKPYKDNKVLFVVQTKSSVPLMCVILKFATGRLLFECAIDNYNAFVGACEKSSCFASSFDVFRSERDRRSRSDI